MRHSSDQTGRPAAAPPRRAQGRAALFGVLLACVAAAAWLGTAVRDAPAQGRPLSLERRAAQFSTKPAPPSQETRLPTFVNSLGMRFVLIPSGRFLMGEEGADMNEVFGESPVHEVIISQPFYLGMTEVTQREFEQILMSNSEFIDPDRPVERISWHDVQRFIDLLNEREPDRLYRLPTEAEWEYAARAGSTTPFFFGDDPAELSRYAWCDRNSSQTQPVALKAPNPWGLYDVYGNVWEWVSDWFDPFYYQVSELVDPQGPSEGLDRGARGGAWDWEPQYCRSAHRNYEKPLYAWSDRGHLGFRLVLEVDPRSLQMAEGLVRPGLKAAEQAPPGAGHEGRETWRPSAGRKLGSF
jgi:formylglycine-generating enzyme required for sulfatase activity